MLFPFQRTVQNASGDAVPDAEVKVYHAGTFDFVDLYEEINGSTPIDQSTTTVTSDSNGHVLFYYASGIYDVYIEKGSFSRVLVNHRVGLSWDELAGHPSDSSDLNDMLAPKLEEGDLSRSNWDEAYDWGDHAQAGYVSDNDLTSHTDDSTIHFTQSQISITESQISDLGNYAVVGHTHTLSDITDSGTAAGRDIGTANGDVMQQTSEGLGGFGYGASGSNVADHGPNRLSGFYQGTGSTGGENLPPWASNFGGFINTARTGNLDYRHYIHLSGGNASIGWARYQNGALDDHVEAYHTGNLDPLETVSTQHSLTGDGADTALSLVNDLASPGADKMYATNGSGVKGWYDIPAGGGGSVDESTDYNWEGVHHWDSGGTPIKFQRSGASHWWNINHATDGRLQFSRRDDTDGALGIAAEFEADGTLAVQDDIKIAATESGIIHAGMGVRSSNRAELFLNSNTVGAPADISFGYGKDVSGDNVRWSWSDRGDGGPMRLYMGPANGGYTVHTDFRTDGQTYFNGRLQITGGYNDHLRFVRSSGTDFIITRLNTQNGGCSTALDGLGQAGELNWLDTSAATTLYVGGRSLSGVSSRVAADTFYNPSDERFKMDWEPIIDPLGMVQRMARGRMGWYTHIKTGRRRFGMGAQTAEAEIKELVEEEDGYLAMSYDRLSVLGVAASAQAADRLEELEQRVKELEAICSTSSK